MEAIKVLLNILSVPIKIILYPFVACFAICMLFAGYGEDALDSFGIIFNKWFK